MGFGKKRDRNESRELSLFATSERERQKTAGRDNSPPSKQSWAVRKAAEEAAVFAAGASAASAASATDPETPELSAEDRSFFLASETGDADTVRRLLDGGAQVSKTNDDGLAPLHLACHNGCVETARLLLDRGAQIDQTASVREVLSAPLLGRPRKSGPPMVSLSPFDLAYQSGHVEVARLLLDRGAPVDKAHKNGDTNLHRIFLDGTDGCSDGLPHCRTNWVAYVDLARLLLDRGAQVDKAN